MYALNIVAVPLATLTKCGLRDTRVDGRFIYDLIQDHGLLLVLSIILVHVFEDTECDGRC